MAHKIVVITQPHYYNGEAERITQMFEAGLQHLHLRKPQSSLLEYQQLLDAIPQCYHSRIVIHEHFSLLKSYSLHGIHLNKRNPLKPEWWKGHVSRSCHSIEEVRRCKDEFDYVSLSPIYDSISKQGYTSHFTIEEIRKAHEAGIIDKKVLALGGISHDKIEETLRLGFGGVMMLGDAWRIDPLPVVLSIAGSDSSGGAGIQQDSKVITACQCYASTCITAVTAQNTLGVQRVGAVDSSMVRAQIESVSSDLHISAIKIGMIPNASVALAIADAVRSIKSLHPIPVIYDPVMVSTSGTALMEEDCIDIVIKHLLPLCTLITPNIPEYELLSSLGVDFSLLSNLRKGGHADTDAMTDILWIAEEKREVSFSVPKINSSNLHGTGCTLSSAIAAYMAKGSSLCTATEKAKRLITDAIKRSATLSIGHGNGPLAIINP